MKTVLCCQVDRASLASSLSIVVDVKELVAISQSLSSFPLKPSSTNIHRAEIESEQANERDRSLFRARISISSGSRPHRIPVRGYSPVWLPSSLDSNCSLHLHNHSSHTTTAHLVDFGESYDRAGAGHDRDRKNNGPCRPNFGAVPLRSLPPTTTQQHNLTHRTPPWMLFSVYSDACSWTS